MELHAKTVRSQLNFFKPFVANCSLEVTRKGQDKLGELMTALHKREVMVKEHDFGRFQGAWIMPKDERRNGVVLYLHGGGYTCGSLEYAKGFGATLASEAGVRVFCAAYRLAPENRYPAALDDALEGYNYLLRKGYSTKQIMLCGESAGGGLIFALCLKLKQLGQALPCGLIGISPWTDLTGSGDSYETNKDVDPSMTQELLQFYAQCYTDDAADPLCSPLFGDLTGLPPSLLFVGGEDYSPLALGAIVLVCVGAIGLGVVDATEDPELRLERQKASNYKYAKSFLALALPAAYCLLDAAGTFADNRVLEILTDRYMNAGMFATLRECADQAAASANCAYELTFLAAAAFCFIYVVIIKKDRLVPKMEAPKYFGAICETAGQFAYIYALADTAHVALAAPIISAYCVASVLWSRIFLKEKLSWKHYAMIALVVAGIVILGVYDA